MPGKSVLAKYAWRWVVKSLSPACAKGHHFADKDPYSQSCGFSSSHVQIWELDHEECWALKNWHFRTVVLEKTPESPLDCKEMEPVNHKGNQPWYSLEGLMLKLKFQNFGHLVQRGNSLEKILILGKRPGGEGGYRGWDGWMASLTQWTWVWANSGRW